MEAIYFAWVDAGEPFNAAVHNRSDENIYSLSLKQKEGGFAYLTIVVRNPRVGLLSPGRKFWAWVSIEHNNAVYPLFYGQMIGTPSNIFAEQVTLEFRARPLDYLDRKHELADSLRVLPWYDPVWYDERKRLEPDTVFEGYSGSIHVDRLTHALTLSDWISGDSLLEYGESGVLYDGLESRIVSVPIRSVLVRARAFWTQIGQTTSDVMPLIYNQYTNIDDKKGFLSTFTAQGLESSWPQPGANIGGGLSTAQASLNLDAPIKLETTTISWKTDNKPSKPDTGPPISSFDGGQVLIVVHNVSGSETKVVPPKNVRLYPQPDPFSPMAMGPDDVIAPIVMTKGTSQRTSDTKTGATQSMSDSITYQRPLIYLTYFRPVWTVAINVARRQIEFVEFALNAEMQPVVTDPEDKDVLELTFDSVDASFPILDNTPAVDPDDVPLVDNRRPIVNPALRSYITTTRGLKSLEHLLMVARAHILAAARAIEHKFVLRDFMEIVDVSLRKNARILDPRLPGGEVTGKITEYELTVQNGAVLCTVTMVSTVGYGGNIDVLPGEPTYVEADYVEPDYQEYENAVVAPNSDIGYKRPLANPKDDGINLLGATVPANQIVNSVVVANGPVTQRDEIMAIVEAGVPEDGAIITSEFGSGSLSATWDNTAAYQEFSSRLRDMLKDKQTSIKVVFRNLQKEFESPYLIEVEDLKVPKMIDLEAGSTP